MGFNVKASYNLFNVKAYYNLFDVKAYCNLFDVKAYCKLFDVKVYFNLSWPIGVKKKFKKRKGKEIFLWYYRLLSAWNVGKQACYEANMSSNGYGKSFQYEFMTGKCIWSNKNEGGQLDFLCDVFFFFL